MAASVCQTFALDNGAFSLWKAGKPVDWDAYYGWVAQWLSHPACDWAVIPDVIEGTEEENDDLIASWPFGHRGVPVWHLNEAPSRLVRMVQDGWPRVALGSSGEFDVSSPRRCVDRLLDVLPLICNDRMQPAVKLHGLRMLNPAITTAIPLSSGDSTNVARNIGIDLAWKGTYAPATKETRAQVLVERVERHDTPGWLPSGRTAAAA